MEQRAEDLILVEDTIWVLTAPTGKAAYDFRFDLLACRRPHELPPMTAVCRVGAITNYDEYFVEWASRGVRLMNDPHEHRRAAELPTWYPILEGLTPRSIWSSDPPDPDLIAKELGWPIFMKGSRQTSHHKKSLAIIPSADAYVRAIAGIRQDPILHWQDFVCRQFVPLRPVESVPLDRIPSSFEFRTFWWRGVLVGFGRYWWEGRSYAATPTEREAAIGVANQAAQRLNIPFVVIDVAQAEDGSWLVIECNDAQESGYAGVSSIGLWQRIVELERALSPVGFGSCEGSDGT